MADKSLFRSKWGSLGAGDEVATPFLPDEPSDEVSSSLGSVAGKNHRWQTQMAADAVSGAYDVDAARKAKQAAEEWANQQRSANQTNQLLGILGKGLSLFIPKLG